jgi:hypothetical protein
MNLNPSHRKEILNNHTSRVATTFQKIVNVKGLLQQPETFFFIDFELQDGTNLEYFIFKLSSEIMTSTD